MSFSDHGYVNVVHIEDTTLVRLYENAPWSRRRGRLVKTNINKLKSSIALAKLTANRVVYFVHLGPFSSKITESRFFKYLENIEKYSTLYHPVDGLK